MDVHVNFFFLNHEFLVLCTYSIIPNIRYTIKIFNY